MTDNIGPVQPIAIRGILLLGPQRSYRVDFFEIGNKEDTRSLSIIAGEISTGKTTILELVDWCLGAKEHPEHDEILANVRSVQLAVRVRVAPTDGSPLSSTADFVIERPLGPPSTKAWLYQGDLSEKSELPVRSLDADPASENSISQYLLQQCGLSNIRLRRAPTQEESPTSVLSFRDLKPLWFLSNRRMDNASLVLEKEWARALRLTQVLDILFGVSDDLASELGQRIEALAVEERELRRALIILTTFLRDAGVEDLEQIDELNDSDRVELAGFVAQQQVINSTLHSRTRFGRELRAEFVRSASTVDALESEIRDRETLARRLDPLRAQYADELRKLELAAESRSIFDALLLVTCPACQQELDTAPSIEDGRCTLCSSPVAPSWSDDHSVSSVEAGSGLAIERSGLKRRLTQLKEFSSDVRGEADAARASLAAARSRMASAQDELDRATRDVVAPFLSERDALARKAAAISEKIQARERSRAMMLQLRQKQFELDQTRGALADLKERRRAHLLTQTEGSIVRAQIADRMESILVAFGYPKVELVSLGKNYVPNVRGRRYDKVGSSGAMTLIALAWELAIFELAVEAGSGHPGFLLIDSPQKNLRPNVGDSASGGETLDLITRNRSSIGANIYAHIRLWLAANKNAQIIFVDNEPPVGLRGCEVVRYSGDAKEPPYGLIDNEDGRPATPAVT